MNEDIVDRYGNQIHIACLSLQRLRKQQPFAEHLSFQLVAENYCRCAKELLRLIRALAPVRE